MDSQRGLVMVVALLAEVPLRGLPTRNDRLQKDRLLVFDERHQVHVLVSLNDEDGLGGVAVRVLMFQDVKQIATFLTAGTYDLVVFVRN